MKLVIDTNCIISSLIKNGWSRRIIVSPAITFIAPEFTLKEITNHKDLITKKTNSSDKEFFLLMELLFTNIDIIPSVCHIIPFICHRSKNDKYMIFNHK